MASNRKKSTDQDRKALATISGQNNKNINVPETCDVHVFIKNHPFLSTLLRKDGVLFECDGDAPSPSKDYGQLQITLDKVILRWWKITLRNVEGSMYPGEIKDSYEDFYHDEVAQREIWRIFGQPTLNHCLNIVRGKYDWLTYLPSNVQIRILSYVNLDDIPQISLVSKTLRALGRHNDLWRIFYTRHYGQNALENRDLIHLAERRGWRHVFFTNRLKLQMQLRRESRLEHYHPEDPSDLVKARERRPHIRPSPPTTPRQQQRFAEPTIRRHSFATRKESPLVSPRASPLPDQERSPRTPRSYIGEMGDSPRTRRPPSPSVSMRSNAGSVASTSSALPPVEAPHRSTTRR
jgi:F-box protein 36